MSRQSVRIVRVVALSGAAAAAALGVAGPASATTHPAMPSSSYVATSDHHAAVANLAASPTPTDGSGVHRFTLPGVGTNPASGTYPATGVNGQVSTQSTGTVAAGTAATMLLLCVIVFAVRHGKVRVTWVIASAVLGVLLAGTVFGAMANQMAGSGVASLSSILGNL